MRSRCRARTQRCRSRLQGERGSGRIGSDSSSRERDLRRAPPCEDGCGEEGKPSANRQPRERRSVTALGRHCCRRGLGLGGRGGSRSGLRDRDGHGGRGGSRRGRGDRGGGGRGLRDRGGSRRGRGDRGGGRGLRDRGGGGRGLRDRDGHGGRGGSRRGRGDRGGGGRGRGDRSRDRHRSPSQHFGLPSQIRLAEPEGVRPQERAGTVQSHLLGVVGGRRREPRIGRGAQKLVATGRDDPNDPLVDAIGTRVERVPSHCDRHRDGRAG
jgi:hypothetical protein